MNMKLSGLWASLLLGGVLSAGTAKENNMFHFLTAPLQQNNITDVTTWLPRREAGADGYVRLDGKGGFRTDSGPIKFWGTNFVYEANFPPTREMAERVASTLARFGFNCVRMHHMDYAGHGIWEGSPDNKTVNARKLDMLDYLIYQLKKHGIYVNINLHVLREFGPKEGFNAPPPTQMGKGINEIHPRMIELQKKYAKDLLTHVNPYTKLSYCEDPAIAFIELNNENSLLNWWRYGALDNMVPEYGKPMQDKWNKWLKKKYGNDANLKKAWNIGSDTLGAEILADTAFAPKSADNKKQWSLQSHPWLNVREEFIPGKGINGKPVRRFSISRKKENNLGPQIVTNQTFSVKKGQSYTLTLHSRTKKPQYVKVNCMKSYAPWGVMLGLNAFTLTKPNVWEKHEFVFCATENDDRARITVIMDPQGEYEFSDISLRPGGAIGLLPGQSMENLSIPMVRRHFLSQTRMSIKGLYDAIDFIYETEREYNKTMYDYIRKDLKAKALITGSQVHVSPLGLQTEFDFVDNHTYWHHPVFPKGESWNKAAGWYVLNEAMVNALPGTIGTIASQRVAGQPYVISEYNHAEPNQFVTEGFPMLAAYAAFQNWNGLYSFAYSHGNAFEINYIPGFFDIRSCANRMVHMAACVAMFVRGDVMEAKKVIHAPFTIAMERSQLRFLPDPDKLRSELYGLDRKYSLLHGIGLKKYPDWQYRNVNADKEKLPAKNALKDQKLFVSDTGELLWDARKKDKGFFMVNTSRTKVFTGFCDEKGVDLDGFSISGVKSFSGAATISAVCADGRDMRSPGRILLAASGVAYNRDAVFELMPPGNKSTLRKNWGANTPIMCEGITAKVKFDVPAGKLTVYALDGKGNRVTAVPVSAENGKAAILLSPEYKTLWYEVIIK